MTTGVWPVLLPLLLSPYIQRGFWGSSQYEKSPTFCDRIYLSPEGNSSNHPPATLIVLVQHAAPIVAQQHGILYHLNEGKHARTLQFLNVSSHGLLPNQISEGVTLSSAAREE